MKVIVLGHTYELENLENKSEEGQILQFINKKPAEVGSSEMVTVSDGTTNEDVIEVLIDRLNYLNGLFPCRENSLAITKLEEALFWLNARTRNRDKRGVEGRHEK